MKTKLMQTSLLKKGRRVVLRMGYDEETGVIIESYSRRTATCKVLRDDGICVAARRVDIIWALEMV